ncbi:MAG TPA: hypothetical protein VH583_20250 [Vicinamibacterales bacterium]
MNVGRVGQFAIGVAASLALVGAAPSPAMAQDHDHGASQVSQDPKGLNALVQIVRQVTAPFPRPEDAEHAGFQLMFGCVTGPDFGAMGMHFVNGQRLDDQIDAYEPEIILYEPLGNGKFRLLGADYLVDKAAWDAKHPNDPPQLYGQIFQLIDAPNRFGLDAFYTLHVWAWKDNPNGSYVNWNPNVSCDGFKGQN